jgi:choline kinase
MQVAQELPYARLNFVERPDPEVFSIAPTLVVLAAGLGSRFGGDKQFTALGPQGETLMDYAIFDAARAGIERVVLVVRGEALGLLPSLRQRYGRSVELLAAAQALDDLPAGFTPPASRTRPWGTAHAIRAVRDQVTGPLMVVNGDDFYGAAPYRALLDATRHHPAEWQLAGYGIRETLSPTGPVNRAICRVDADGFLTGLEEVRGIAKRPDGSLCAGIDPARSIPGDAIVSMNMWGLTPSIFAVIERAFTEFLRRADLSRDEYYLPEAIAEAMTGGQRVRVLPARGDWCGVTFPEDAAAVREHLAALIATGKYPAPLWP